MGYNNFKYTRIPIAQKTLAESKGFRCENISTDGQWIISGKGDKEDCSDWIVSPELPEYMIDLGIISCCLTHEMSCILDRTRASFKGGSDGFFFPEDDI